MDEGDRHETGSSDNLREGGLCGTERGGAMIDTMLQSGWAISGAQDLTHDQFAFLAGLRKGRCPATAAQDAVVIGPLIRANLVRWDDDPSETGTLRKLRGTNFTLTSLGEVCLVEHQARERLLEARRDD
jgi:hypothetical protein